MPERSPQLLIDLLKTKGVVTFPDLQAVLGRASRATTFRYLRQVQYLRSYNYNGRYYTQRDPARFDRWGLYSVGDIYFWSNRGQTTFFLVVLDILGMRTSGQWLSTPTASSSTNPVCSTTAAGTERRRRHLTLQRCT